MTEDLHPLKEAIIDLGTWLEIWRDQSGLQPLVDAVRESWMDYVAGSGMFVIPTTEGKLADVILIRGRDEEPSE